jgi:hypothetical protein
MIPMHDRKKGIILVESMLGIFLLASIILYSISSFVVGKYVTRLSKERFIVSNLLREDMENFLSVNYSTIVDGLVSTDIAINDGSRTFPATKTLEPSTMEEGIYGYKKIYGKIEWLGGISGAQTLQEEMVIYVTKQ